MKILRWAALLAFLLAIGFEAHLLAGPPDDVKNGLSSYMHWEKANERLAPMDPAVAILCSAPAPRAPNDPHAKYYVSVFVNKTGIDAMKKEVPGPFPIGSMIVKQKLRDKKSQPELLTMMVKREVGYNPKVGDWEFVVASGDGNVVFGRGKLEQCQGCHASMAKQDYVYRTYSAPTPSTVPQLQSKRR